MLLIIVSCEQSKSKHQILSNSDKNTSNIARDQQEFAIEQNQNPTDFLPSGYVVFDKIYGDLNKDGLDDCAIIIKGTNKNKIINDQYRGQLDRNRRGIIVLFKKNKTYELIVKNYNCFSSENEDGGIYFAPELSAEIKNGNLQIHYGHGRYGYWKYTFSYQNSDFELIGYEADPAIKAPVAV